MIRQPLLRPYPRRDVLALLRQSRARQEQSFLAAMASTVRRGEVRWIRRRPCDQYVEIDYFNSTSSEKVAVVAAIFGGAKWGTLVWSHAGLFRIRKDGLLRLQGSSFDVGEICRSGSLFSGIYREVVVNSGFLVSIRHPFFWDIEGSTPTLERAMVAKPTVRRFCFRIAHRHAPFECFDVVGLDEAEAAGIAVLERTVLNVGILAIFSWMSVLQRPLPLSRKRPILASQ